jgi:hypothetical protein
MVRVCLPVCLSVCLAEEETKKKKEDTEDSFADTVSAGEESLAAGEPEKKKVEYKLTFNSVAEAKEVTYFYFGWMMMGPFVVFFFDGFIIDHVLIGCYENIYIFIYLYIYIFVYLYIYIFVYLYMIMF